jgi:histidinol-phosphate aminotransferase
MKRKTITTNKYLAGIAPYEVSESAKLSVADKLGCLKLDWNEATIPPSARVIKAVQEILNTRILNFYPDVTASELRNKLSAYVGLDESYIQVFNGSDDALRVICETFLDADDIVLIREPTYTQINIFIATRGAKILNFTGQTAFTMEVDKYDKYLNENDVKLVYIANPNNPTGVMYEQSVIERLCARHGGTLFLVDEAYYEYSGHTVCGLISRYPNVVVTRTFSKAFGLAGLRIGYVLAHPDILNSINIIRNGKDVNLVAQIAASAALEDLEHVRNYTDEIKITGRWLAEKLRGIGFEVHETPANFLLMKVPNSRKFVDLLKANKVLVRDRNSLPQLNNYVRITLGSREQMEQLLDKVVELTPYIRYETLRTQIDAETILQPQTVT